MAVVVYDQAADLFAQIILRVGSDILMGRRMVAKLAMNHAQVNAYPNGEFGRLESRWANALNDGSDVRIKIDPIYEPANTTSRPDRYRITEWIYGD